MDLFGNVSTVDTGERSEFDFYETPAWMTRSLLHFHPRIRRTRVLECCSGRNAIAEVLRREGLCQVYTNDVDTRHPAEWHDDATRPTYWETAPPVDWVITNPPFNLAFPILAAAVEHALVGVALLVRKTFLEPTEERGGWLAEHPPTRLIGLPRHAFRGSGSDSVSCDWMIWQRHERSLIAIDYLAKTRTRPCC